MKSLWKAGNERCQAIAAAAGSGKTYRLAHRLIGLLAHGVDPERIVALTFSRKAAGEIFNDVLRYLWEGAREVKGANIHSDAAYCDASVQQFRIMLRRFLSALPRIKIQTLDSFAVGIVQAFPGELGLADSPRLMAENQSVLDAARVRVIAESLGTSGFLRDLEHATAGREDKSIIQTLCRLVDGYHPYAWSGLAWGIDVNARVRAMDLQPTETPEADGDALRNLFRDERFVYETKKAIKVDKRVAKGFAEAVDILVGGGAEDLIKNRILQQLVEGRPALCLRSIEISYYRPWLLTDAECRLLRGLVDRMLMREYERMAEESSGIGKLVSRYEAIYDQEVRSLGILSFTDAQLLLSPAFREATGRDALLNVAYRMDGRFDHWLLDEFQDTSDLQWNVLQPLIEETICDTSETRSFFYVGDVKQSIYQWREGNPRLFRLVQEQFGNITEETLPVCRRQSPAVIQTVNRVFGNLPDCPVVGDTSLPAAAVAQWRSQWYPHESVPGREPGYVGLFEALPGVEDEADPVTAVVAEILHEVDPARRGLSVAVLTRRNATAAEMAETLQDQCPGFEVALEGRSTICDSPSVQLLLAVLNAAAHPADTLSWGHVQMSPLGHFFASEDELCRTVFAELADCGLEQWIERWSRRLKECAGGLSDDEQEKLRALVKAGADFADVGDATVCSFRKFVEYHSSSRRERAGADVRVMTVHQAKGLGFDVVIFPELRPRNCNMAKSSGDRVLVDREGGCILKAPNRLIAGADPLLSVLVSGQDSDNCFEELCVLYVAMTRSKKALYLVGDPRPKQPSSVGYDDLLHVTIGEREAAEISIGGRACRVWYEHGNRQWY